MLVVYKEVFLMILSFAKLHDSNAQKYGIGSGVAGLVEERLSKSIADIKEIMFKLFIANPPQIGHMREKKNAWLEAIANATGQEAQINLTDIRKSRRHTLPRDLYKDVQLIHVDGHKTETHKIETSDGYTLTVHRIFPRYNTNKQNSVVMLHHGFLGCSFDWIHLGPGNSLPYLLSNKGYDVWLLNARGNRYSRTHNSYDESSSQFWDFTFNEIGTHDLPAVIQYIKDLSHTEPKIDYIGYSMGATALLALLSARPQFNSMFRSAVLLAPLSFMGHAKGPLRYLSEFYFTKKNTTYTFFGDTDFRSSETFPPKIVKDFCKGEKYLCKNPLLLIANGGKMFARKNITERVMRYTPAGASSKTLLHYLQLIKSGKFETFNTGSVKNVEKYGHPFTKKYRLDNIRLPMFVFSSRDDWLSTVPDTCNLLDQLPYQVMHHIVQREDFTHTDFVWGADAPKLIYHQLLDILENVSPKLRLEDYKAKFRKVL